MINEYKCTHCKICFKVGWYHHANVGGYSSTTLLVCKECGVMHRIKHPHERKRRFFELKAPPKMEEVIMAQKEPLINHQEDESDVFYCASFHWGLSTPTKEQSYTGLLCMHCHAANSLVEEIPEDDDFCLRCKKRTLMRGSRYYT